MNRRSALTARWRVAAALLGVAILVVLLLPGAVTAKDGRDFAGFYDLGEITDLGEQVQVRLTVLIFNYSGGDVSGGKVSLEDTLIPGKDYGSFTQIADIADHESIRLSEEFTVPRREYEQWQKGATPRLHIEFEGSAGKQVRCGIELIPGAFLKEDQP